MANRIVRDSWISDRKNLNPEKLDNFYETLEEYEEWKKTDEAASRLKYTLASVSSILKHELTVGDINKQIILE